MSEGTMYSEIHREIDRCRNLLKAYEEIGPVGKFGHAMIGEEIRKAERALEGADVTALTKALAGLRGCK